MVQGRAGTGSRPNTLRRSSRAPGSRLVLEAATSRPSHSSDGRRPESTVTLTPDSGSPMTLRFGDAFVTYGDPLNVSKSIEARVVLVGFGVTAPELKIDDYAGVDVRGKIVAYFTGAPKQFPDSLRAHYSSSLGKIDNAAAHGAIGAIVITTAEEAARAPWDRVVRGSKLGSMHWLESDGSPHAVHKELSSSVSLGLKGTEMFLAAAGKSLADLTRHSTSKLSFPAAVARLRQSHQRS